MRKYAYFPGCSSSEGTAASYGQSAEAVSSAIGIELIELENWNCCGSTPYSATAELESLCIAVRNLALAEKTGMDIVTPCSSCYTTLSRANSQLKAHPDLRAKVTECLAVAGLEYNGNVKVRHLFEVIYHDIGLEELKSKVVSPLTGLKVAPYYGCQMVRPEFCFEGAPENPQVLEQFLKSIGAEPVPYPMKVRCCGGSLVIPELEQTLSLIHKLLESAANNGAQCIVTTCPLCYVNLDSFQDMINKKFKTNYKLPVLLFTQLVGLAVGVEPKKLVLDKGSVPAVKILAPYMRAKAKV